MYKTHKQGQCRNTTTEQKFTASAAALGSLQLWRERNLSAGPKGMDPPSYASQAVTPNPCNVRALRGRNMLKSLSSSFYWAMPAWEAPVSV
ncbi:hypothetical protein Nepgr_013338 [Nepenthes gracilis]|uniref:Uncharacterized protein n=1 Tax=Nepenthes gracilis TaxID=150966 RepID=A0AAD3SHY6_NEPGR|nr:hypothetical protein Nepgr_013338 [Nepenthes gracilis]